MSPEELLQLKGGGADKNFQKSFFWGHNTEKEGVSRGGNVDSSLVLRRKGGPTRRQTSSSQNNLNSRERTGL